MHNYRDKKINTGKCSSILTISRIQRCECEPAISRLPLDADGVIQLDGVWRGWVGVVEGLEGAARGSEVLEAAGGSLKLRLYIHLIFVTVS